MLTVRVVVLLCTVQLVQGCGIYSSAKDQTASFLNPRKIHSAFDSTSPAAKAGSIPVADYYASLELARSKYVAGPSGEVQGVSFADQAYIQNYVSEGIGLVDAYCARWFQGLDDTSRLVAYQEKNVNVITQLGTAFLGLAGATSALVTGYGAGTTAYAGISENFTTTFLVAPTAAKVKQHIVSVMDAEAVVMKREAANMSFKDAYTRLERYADLCTHTRAKEIVNTSLDLTKTQIDTNSNKIETVNKDK